MRKTLLGLGLAVGLLMARPAGAHVSVAVGLPGLGIFLGLPAPVIYAPAPVYAPPAVYPPVVYGPPIGFGPPVGYPVGYPGGYHRAYSRGYTYPVRRYYGRRLRY